MKRSIEQAQLNEETQSSTKKFGKGPLYQATKICPLEMILESANETSEVNNKIKGQVMQEYQRLLSLESRAIDSDLNLSNNTPIPSHELKEQVITSAKQKIVSGLSEMQKCYDQFSFFSQMFINRQQALKQEQEQQQQTEQQQQQQQIEEQDVTTTTTTTTLIVSNSVPSPLEEGVIFDLCVDQFSHSEMIENDGDILLAKISYSSSEDEDDEDEEDDDEEDDEYSDIVYEDEEEQIKTESAQQKLKTLKDDVQCTRNWILSLLEKVNKLESVSS